MTTGYYVPQKTGTFVESIFLWSCIRVPYGLCDANFAKVDCAVKPGQALVGKTTIGMKKKDN